jgi:hypothetical protein
VTLLGDGGPVPAAAPGKAAKPAKTGAKKPGGGK